MYKLSYNAEHVNNIAGIILTPLSKVKKVSIKILKSKKFKLFFQYKYASFIIVMFKSGLETFFF